MYTRFKEVVAAQFDVPYANLDKSMITLAELDQAIKDQIVEDSEKRNRA
jgi:hypothetical protein